MPARFDSVANSQWKWLAMRRARIGEEMLDLGGDERDRRHAADHIAIELLD
jgi:hypothetical protein